MRIVYTYLLVSIVIILAGSSLVSCLDHRVDQLPVRLEKETSRVGFFSRESNVKDYSYDNAGRLVSIRSYSTAAPTSITVVELTYDSQNRVNRIDQRYSITSSSTKDYGKRSDFLYGPASQELTAKTYRALSDFGTFQYEYEQRFTLNEKGQVINEKKGDAIDIGSYSNYEYTYDNDNLLKATIADYSANTVIRRTQYSYIYVINNNPYYKLPDPVSSVQRRFSRNIFSQETILELDVVTSQPIRVLLDTQILSTSNSSRLPIESRIFPINVGDPTPLTTYVQYEYEPY